MDSCQGVMNGEGGFCEMDGITRETDVSLDEMMSLACRQGKLDIVELLLESGARVDYRNKAGNTPLLEACSQGHNDVAQYLLEHEANIDAPTDTTSDSALTWACTLGNDSIVELLLTRKGNVEHRTKDGCTALMFAALAGHVKVATMLLDYHANINVESDSNKDSPLTFACWKGHVDVVELLLERNANIEHRTKEGFTPLMFAALGGHTAVAKKLLQRQAKVNEPSGSNNDIPLTSACWKGHHEVVKLLLEYKSNIEHRTKDGCTPLMLAAREGHLIVAQLILDSGALVNVPSGSENNIPLTLACWKGHTDVVELLLDHNSDKEHRNKAGCTPLMLAAREGHLATTKLLLSRGAEVNTPSGSNDDTPLTLACWKGHHEVVFLLLEHGSSVDNQTKTGCTPLMEATREGHVKVVCLLLENGADVELPDNYGQSPLFMACWKGHRDVAELLLKHNANRECRTKTGITPLFQACRENHVPVVELLLDQGASVSAPFPNSRENPMTLAAEKGYVELMEVLLNRGGNVDCRTKKGCSPFFLACREGHLEIARSLYKNSADIEVCDQRNLSPLVAAFRNGHHKVVEWILSITKHVPSDEQCQKCITAPLEGKDSDRDLLYLRTTCYEMIKKAKKVKEQAAFQNAESFLQELEDDKVREENKKKKLAAKRRDKRKKKKKQKDEQRNNVVEPLPSENRTNDEENTCSEEETSRLVISTRIPSQIPANDEQSGHDVFEHVSHCRTKTVGQALGEKGNKNSTEERRDDQPQAVFDASDHQETSSPKRKQETIKLSENGDSHTKNNNNSSKASLIHSGENRGTQSPTKDEENNVSYTTISMDKNNGKETSSEEFNELGDEFTTKSNKLSTSVTNTDAYLKENGKITASRSKQAATVSSFINSWKEVTRSTGSKALSIQLTAPNALCGRVIGRGGTKINSITDESGAQITIGKADPKTPGDRVITIKGTGKAVQKAKLLVSQALNTPSGATQVQTPNLCSSPPPSSVPPQNTYSVAPIRGNFAAIPSSSVEWPTVAQAHRIGSAKELMSSNKTEANDEKDEDLAARQARPNSAPDIYSEAVTEHRNNESGQKVWSAENTPPPLVSNTVVQHRVVSTAGEVTPSSANPAKIRTKSYALTQDVSRLSYCEVATGENGLYKLDDTNKVSSATDDKPSLYSGTNSAPPQRSEEDYEGDNVFVNDNSFSEIDKCRFDDCEEIVATKEQLASCSLWNEENKGVLENETQVPDHSTDSTGQGKPMDMLPPSSSLFSGAPWPNREQDDSDKTRSVSWSGQNYPDCEEQTTPEQSSQPDIASLSSHSIWSPVQPKGVVSDSEVEGTGWAETSNSASSSRSSSRLELSSIMDNEKNSPFLQTSPPHKAGELEVMDRNVEEYQSSWLSTRGAHSAPSSPSLVRARDQRQKQSRPITAQSNSYDDMSDRLWSRHSDVGSSDMNWNDGMLQYVSSPNVYHVSSDADQGKVSSPKLGSLKQYEPPNINKWSDPLLDRPAIPEVLRLLERLSLTKYNQTFEDHFITMENLLNMSETDLQTIGIPKGPRLKIMHALTRGNNGVTNGPVVSSKPVNDRVPSSDVLNQIPGSGSGSLLNHLHMDSRVSRFPSVVPSQMMPKSQPEPLNPMLLSYLSNTATHHPLLSLDAASIPPTHSHGHVEQQQPLNGLAPQQQYMMPGGVQPNEQYDQQNSYIGTPYQQAMYYSRPPGPYYYYP